MAKIEKTSTANWEEGQWQAWRKKVKSIGGSDAACILGLNPYKSPMALWMEKTGRVEPEDLSGKEAVRLGNDLEEYVAKRWAEATEKKVRRERNILYNPQYPWAHANIDRAVVGETDAGLECKTTSSDAIARDCREGRVPATYYCQCVHYMMITGARRWYLAVLVFGEGFYEFTIERDEGECSALARAEQDFYRHIENDTPPAVDGAPSTLAAIGKLYAGGSGEHIDLAGQVGNLEAYAAMKDNIKRLETQLAEMEANIKMYMGNAEKGSCPGYSVSWKTQERSTFDRTRWEADHGKIPEEYFKKSTSRPFKVTQKGA